MKAMIERMKNGQSLEKAAVDQAEHILTMICQKSFESDDYWD